MGAVPFHKWIVRNARVELRPAVKSDRSVVRAPLRVKRVGRRIVKASRLLIEIGITSVKEVDLCIKMAIGVRWQGLCLCLEVVVHVLLLALPRFSRKETATQPLGQLLCSSEVALVDLRIQP